MHENQEPVAPSEHPTDAEIMWAIRYLDPDISAEKGGEDAGTVFGIGITSLAMLTCALTYIWVYMGKL